MFTRRKFFSGAAALIGGSALFKRIAQGAEVVAAQSPAPASSNAYPPVVTPNGSSLPWKMVGGAKEFHLVAEPPRREFAPGMLVNCWGYNGQTPGPTLEAVEGDRVRILVTNHLPEPTTGPWHRSTGREVEPAGSNHSRQSEHGPSSDSFSWTSWVVSWHRWWPDSPKCMATANNHQRSAGNDANPRVCRR